MKNWAAIVTQCNTDQLELPIEEQMQEPLGFLGGAFRETQRNWSTFEQEAYAIFQAFERMDYMMLYEENIHLFTDHGNLLFVFNPVEFNPSLWRHIINKVQRWALYLFKFMYTIEHIQGAKNVTADMLTYWYTGYRGKPQMARRITAKIICDDLIPSAKDYDDIWPTKEDLMKYQDVSSKLDDAAADTEGIWRRQGLIWIPKKSVEIQLKLLVAAHCGVFGHRGIETTFNALREQYIWDSMEEDVKVFVRDCIHCLVAKIGLGIPRPLTLTEHATLPNEITHFEYIYMGPGSDGFH